MPTDIRQEVAALVARHTRAVEVANYAERTAALTAAKAEVEQVTERERVRLQRELVEAAALSVSSQSGLDERSEGERRRRAALLLADAIDASAANSLAALVASFRKEPTRTLALAIRARWDALNARAVLEIGEPLAPHVMAAVFVDSIIAQPGMAAAVNFLSEQNYGGADETVSALGAFVKARTPQEIQEALTRTETLMLAVAERRRPGDAADPDQTARHALRRTHATHRDLLNARSELDAQYRERELAAFAASYVAPSRERPTLGARIAEIFDQSF